MNENPFLPPSSNLNSRESFGSEMGVNSSVLEGLARTKGWVRFCGILMCIMFALVALQFILAMIGINVVADAGQTRAFTIGSTFGGFIGGFFFYLWPAIRLLRYSKAIGHLLQRKTTAELEEALNIQRGFWKHIGIIVMVFFVIIVVAMFFVITMAVAAAQRH